MKALLLALLLTTPTLGCDKYDAVVADAPAAGFTISPLPSDALEAADAHYGVKATRGFLAQGARGTALGLEVDGCMLPPVWIAPAPSASALPTS